MSFALLSRLAREQPLRMLLVNAGEPDSLAWSGLVQPLRLAQRILNGSFQLDLITPSQAAAMAGDWQLALLVADERSARPAEAELRAVIERCREAAYWGGVGAGVAEWSSSPGSGRSIPRRRPAEGRDASPSGCCAPSFQPTRPNRQTGGAGRHTRRRARWSATRRP